MTYIVLTQDERLHLNRGIKNFNRLGNEKKEEIQLKVLKLMDSYIKNLAYKYAGKSYISFDDYVAEMQLTILKQLPKLKPSNANKKEIETYLYYWCNDACQKLLADMNGPVSYSVTIMRKGFRGEEKIITKECLNNKISADDSKEFVDVVKEKGDPYVDLVLNAERKEFKDTIVSKFGENAFNAFWKKYALSKAYQKRYEKKIEAILDYIKNSPRMIEILRDLAN